MNRGRVGLLISVFFLFFAVSCKKPPVASSTTPAPSNAKAEEEIRNFIVKDIDFKYFESKAKVEYKDANTDQNVSAHIRMKKDSIVWISVVATALGIEGARLLITPDSVFVMDRINNEYQKYGLSFISQKLNIPVSFSMIQSLILGNMPYEKTLKDKLTKVTESDYYILQQNPEKIEVDNYVKASTMKLEKLQMKEVGTENIVRIDYSEFASLETFIFAFSNTVSINYKVNNVPQNRVISVQHKKVDITEKELNFPFNIPQKYVRK